MNSNDVKKTACITSAAVGEQIYDSPAAVGLNRAPGAPTGLLTNESEYPLNVEGAPLFDWWVTDEDLDEVQTAYSPRTPASTPTPTPLWRAFQALQSLTLWQTISPASV